jgi:IS5 family transposase
MLRIHFLHQQFTLSDPAVEEVLHDSQAMRQFVGIDLGQELAPDETTICTFRPPAGNAQWGAQRIGWAKVLSHGLAKKT